MPNKTTDESDNSNREVKHAYSWLGDHGQVDRTLLIELAKDGTAESTERLHELADDNNISYEDNTDLVALAEEISTAMETDGNTGVE